MILRNPVADAVLSRQAIREYTPEQISPDQLETLMRAALRAPSGRNSQPIHARLCQNAAMLRQMQVDFKNIVGWDTPVHTKSDVNPFYHNAPTFAFLFAQGDSRMDAGLMAGNICVCAQGLGLGTVIVASVGALFSDESAGPKWKKALNIPEGWLFMVGVGIGYPDEAPPMKPRNEEQIQVIQ
ncbi:MAG: nitroreductase family protein [Oscillospiraceae bacterium]|jgi:nitroreductase|nr:nitroreductase family protein [Oscillospiraceae bacterium]